MYNTYEVLSKSNEGYITVSNSFDSPRPYICYVDNKDKVHVFYLNSTSLYNFVDSDSEVRVDKCRVKYGILYHDTLVAYIKK